MDAIGLYLLAGDVAATAALAERLARIAPSAQRFHLQAKVAQLAGQTREAEDLATQAWERSEELDPEGRGPLAAILAQLCNMRGDGDAAALWAERALAHELPAGSGRLDRRCTGDGPHPRRAATRGAGPVAARAPSRIRQPCAPTCTISSAREAPCAPPWTTWPAPAPIWPN